MNRPLSWPGFWAACAAIVLWAAGNLIIREAPMPGVQLAFWRIVLGAAVYWIALFPRRQRLTRAQLVASAPAGVALGLDVAVFFVALKATTIANATVIGALVPVVLLGVASRRFGERINFSLVVAVGIALTGVVLVIFGSSDAATWSLRGDILALVGMVLFSAYFAFAKAARATVPAHQFQAAVWITGSILLFPLAVVDARGIDIPSMRSWVWILVLLVVPGTGHLLMNWAHAKIRLSVAGVLTLAIPVLSTLGAVLFLDEGIVPGQIVGMTVVVVALVFIVLQEANIQRGAPVAVPLAPPELG